jgi:hypothetical protein
VGEDVSEENRLGGIGKVEGGKEETKTGYVEVATRAS